LNDRTTYDGNRRLVLRSALGLLGGAYLAVGRAGAEQDVPISRTIPSSGQQIPIVGLGTWITFNVGSDRELIRRRTEVLRTFLSLGGGVVDSSPMYGSSEAVLGQCLDHIGRPQPTLFSATKVWTGSSDEGKDQIAASQRLWGLQRFDVFQVHNLLGWRKHVPHLLELKQAGQLGHVGVTTSHGRRHDELEQIIRTQPIDFVQLTYNMLDREAERRLLPLARDKGLAVIINRPYRRKALIRQFEGTPLPPWAKEIEAHSWAQFLLKFVLSHPAVTCAIPATTRVDHLRENMAAGRGPLPDAATRRAMVDYIRRL